MKPHLQRERITQYIQDTYGTQAEYLWADSPGNAIFRHPAGYLVFAVGEEGGTALENAEQAHQHRRRQQPAPGIYRHITGYY